MRGRLGWLQIALRAGDLFDVASNGLWYCALLCAATGRYADAVTVWAALAVHARQQGVTVDGTMEDRRRREEALSKIGQALGPARVRAAEERGAAMSLDTAVEYALMLTGPARAVPGATSPGLGRLSARERELVTLVARAAPTRRSPRSCTSASAPSAPTWTGSGTRPAAAAAPT